MFRRADRAELPAGCDAGVSSVSGALSMRTDITVGAASVDEQGNTVPGMLIAHIDDKSAVELPAPAAAAPALTPATAASGAMALGPSHGTPCSASAPPTLTPPRP